MDEWPTCKYCGCVTMMIEVDRGYCSNFLCKADHLKAVESRLSAAERERDEWKRSSELVARVLIDTKADLTAAMKLVEAGKEFVDYWMDDFEPRCDEEYKRVVVEKIWKLSEALVAMKKPKGRFLPDIEDLSHTIDFDKPKCGTCGGSGYDRQACKNESPNDCISTCCHGCQDATPCPECGQGKE